MQKIEIKQLVKGALTTEYGYNEIASTPDRAVVPSDFDEIKHKQLYLSKEYASLFVFRTENSPFLSAVHIQGQYTGEKDRAYDTRIFYNIDKDNLEKCNCRIGAIANSLPKMQHYEGYKINCLDSTINIKEIEDADTAWADNLYKRIIHAISSEKRLFIQLNDDVNWKENNVLENREAKTLFAAIDKLPEILQPVASCALSVDGRYDKKFLKYALIILYHGNRKDIDLPEGIEIKWNDIGVSVKNAFKKPEQESITFAQIAIRKYANNKNKKNFFDTELSSRQMLNGIEEMRKSANEKNNKYYLEYLFDQSDRQQEKIDAAVALWDAYNDEQRRNLLKRINAESDFDEYYSNKKMERNIIQMRDRDIRDAVEEDSFDLSNVYHLFKFDKESSAKKYTEVYFNEKISELPVQKQIDTVLKDWLQVRDSDPILANQIEEKLKEQATCYSLDKYGKLLEDNKQMNLYKSFILKCFHNSAIYNRYGIELCNKPFVQHLLPEKKQYLREKLTPDFKDYPELFKDITLNEIENLNVKDESKLKLVLSLSSKEDRRQFIRDKEPFCKSQFETEFLNNRDMWESDIYVLYLDAGCNFPPIDEQKINMTNLDRAVANANILKLDLKRPIAELYSLCNTIEKAHQIWKISRQQPDATQIRQLTVTSLHELDIYAELKKNQFPELPRVDIPKLINEVKQSTLHIDDIEEVVRKLKKLGLDYSEYENLIISKSTKISDKDKQKFRDKYFKDKKISTVKKLPNVNLLAITIAFMLGAASGVLGCHLYLKRRPTVIIYHLYRSAIDGKTPKDRPEVTPDSTTLNPDGNANNYQEIDTLLNQQ
jgi:hypothetical protein